MLLSEDIAERVRDGRRQFDLTQTDLAKLVGVGRLARIEAGETASLLRTRIVALCKATERNIRVDSSRFKPVDITRLRA